jgi:signal transduction histidine kinase
MLPRLCIFCCANFRQEIAAGIAAEGWSDVVAADFPAHCGRPPLSWEALQALLPEGCTQAVVLGRACLSGLGEAPAGFPTVRLLPQEQCFHLVASPSLVAEAMVSGAYLMTPGWLADWRGHLAKMGFPPEASGEFFQDFAKKLMLFDTGVEPDTEARLAELENTVGLPASRLAVGLDHARLLLTKAVLEWRLDEERRAGKERDRHHARELADHVSAMDLLARLASTRQEAEAVAAMEELFRMLFAPADWHYLRVERGRPTPTSAQEVPAELAEALNKLDAPYAWTPSGQGFLLRIARGEQVLGLVAVDRLAFPEYRERYLNLALAMSGVCALAIENARTRKRLMEAEKMASLGVMVAGVAHEINTPVGVGLAASSVLQEQSRRLAQRFAERSMTQSDLQGFLDSAQAEAGLIRSNLERIGQMVDAFRQVAIEGKPLSRRPFRLRACLDDVIASLGERLPAERVVVHILCDPDLEIESFPGDWASIFTNLITNSLRHGFKGREGGKIEIAVTKSAGQLVVDYADDGVGLSDEAQAHIFDPFFTTDLQHGMGLGMNLVYNLVSHRLDGSIACDSTPGQGAHFHLEMPA